MPSATRRPYPENWNSIARAVKTRAGWACQHCHHPHDPKGGYTLTVHHIDGDPQNNHPSNTRALCQRCHMKAAAQQSRYGPQYRKQPQLFDTDITLAPDGTSGAEGHALRQTKGETP